jgi:mannitol 2-dehydrogenase
MKVQNGLYSIVSKTPEGLSDIRVIGSILDVLQEPGDNARVIDLIASNDTKIISLTIKESSYAMNDSYTKLDVENPQIIYDLITAVVPSRPPRTPVGLIVSGLYKRYKNKGKSVTVICTDNIPRGGEVTRVMVEQFAVNRFPLDTGFHQWLQANVFYPNSVADRICLTDPLPDIVSVQQVSGVRDQALLTSESYCNWVIEKWIGDKPDGMEDVGIKFVGTTVPYENLKIRVNYSTRLAVATIANSLGYSKFEEALADQSVLKFANSFMNEAKNGAGDLPKDLDFAQYQKQFIERISTKDLRYQTRRVLEDSSKRIRIDWQPVLENLPAGASTKAFGMTIAVWCHLISESPFVASEVFHPISDVNSGSIQTYAAKAIQDGFGRDGEQVVAQLLSNIFGSEFVDRNNINQNIRDSLKFIQAHGIKGALDRINA